MNSPYLIYILFALPIAVVLGAVIGFLYKQSQAEKAKREQTDEGERLLEAAKEQGRQVEIQARDQALDVLQKAEADNERKRSEMTKEDDRLQKRREELDDRLDRLEKREQA